MYKYEYPRPMVTVDIVIVNPFKQNSILLIERKNEPFKGSFALPGGYVDEGEDTLTAAYRELKEETGLNSADVRLTLISERSTPDRDPRGRTITLVFSGFVKSANISIKAGDDASNAAWFENAHLPPLAFDHNSIIAEANQKIAQKNTRNALLLVDLQNDFMEGGALSVSGGSCLVPIANELMKHFDMIIATQDWHPANHGSFAANHLWRKPGQTIELNGIEQILWPIHCVQNSYGALFHKSLVTQHFEQIFFKGTDPGIDSYSAFFDNAKKRNTGLADYLRARGAKRLFIMGLATDYCILFSVKDAIREGFETFLIKDGCKAVNLSPDDGMKAMEEMKNLGAKTILSSQPVKGIQINSSDAF